MITPDYYNKFKCIAGECKHSCCIGAWDIEVDEDTMARYLSLDGEIGERVKTAIDEDNVFIRQNGRCPMFTEDGLCELVKCDAGLCITCDEYPRFTRDYDDYIEKGLALSCEVATDIILNNKNKVQYVGETGKCEDELFPILYNARKEIFEILQNREWDILKRIRLVLIYGIELRERINNNDFSAFSYTPEDIDGERESITPFVEFIKTLPVTDETFHIMLDNAKHPDRVDDIIGEQLAVYFIHRYFLQSIFDCDPLAKLKFMALSVMTILYMGAGCGDILDAARVYSVEIEHNEDGIDEIYDEFLFNNELEIEKIINMMR